MNTTGLTDDEMRVRIAEACGWKVSHDGPGGDWHGLNPRIHQADDATVTLPDYLNDLNAMHEAENTLTGGDALIRYEQALRRIMTQEDKDEHWTPVTLACTRIWHATARQCALAFLAILSEPEAGR